MVDRTRFIEKWSKSRKNNNLICVKNQMDIGHMKDVKRFV